MDDEADVPAPHRARTVLVIACVVALVVGIGIGGLAAIIGMRASDSDAVACTQIGASDGVSVTVPAELLEGARSLTLAARAGDHTSSTEQVVDEAAADGDASFWLDVPAQEMQTLSAVEVVLHGADGDESFAAESVKVPEVTSPNGEDCEPHVRQAAFIVEDGALVQEE